MGAQFARDTDGSQKRLARAPNILESKLLDDLEQNALLDDDAARVLKSYVGDELAALIAGIDSLLEGAKP